LKSIGKAEDLMKGLKKSKVFFMFLKLSYFKIGLIFEKADPFGNT